MNREPPSPMGLGCRWLLAGLLSTSGEPLTVGGDGHGWA
jgi:hypothetical protein